MSAGPSLSPKSRWYLQQHHKRLWKRHSLTLILWILVLLVAALDLLILVY
jgi:hypothetical protein